MSDRTEMIAEFRSFRLENGLGFNSAFVPKRFADPKDLEIRYWANEDAAADIAKARKGAASAASAPLVRKADRMNPEMFALKVLVAELKTRVAELERKSVEFCGTWKAETKYPERALCSYRGGLWLSKMPSNDTKPGTGPGWRLAVKSGDAK